jgi:hypothetical protein
MPYIYGEGRNNAIRRLQAELDRLADIGTQGEISRDGDNWMLIHTVELNESQR